MITIGIVGCGAVVHSNYAQTLRGRKAYRVGLVTDLVAAQAASAARLFGAEAVSFEDVVERSDAVVVTTPPDTHAVLLRRCLRSGKTVLCEKPFTTSYRDAASLVADANAAGALLYVGHFRRTFPQVELARSLVGMGVIGRVAEIAVSEGGRFTWKTVSDYTVTSESGGVLWDTGSHTLDMALFAAGLDAWPEIDVAVREVTRDKPEPSHDFRGRFTIAGSDSTQRVECRVHLSRKDALPNLVRIAGERGSVTFSVAMDHRVRLTTASGSTVLAAEREHADLMECFDLQMRRILLKQQDQDFSAERFLVLTTVLEALARG